MIKLLKSSQILLLLLVISFTSCNDGKLDVFSVEDNIAMGEQVTAEILANPEEYPILSKTGIPKCMPM